MSFLTEALPQTVWVMGRPYHIQTDFRVWIDFTMHMKDKDADPAQKLLKMLAMFMDMPPDQEAALTALLAFYAGSGPNRQDMDSHARQPVKASGPIFDFAADSGRIYASFYAVYRLDLLTIAYLHWWAFLALLDGLPPDCALGRVVGFRVADLSGMKGKTLRFYQTMKKRYALNGVPRQTLAQRDAAMMEAVSRHSRNTPPPKSTAAAAGGGTQGKLF